MASQLLAIAKDTFCQQGLIQDKGPSVLLEYTRSLNAIIWQEHKHFNMDHWNTVYEASSGECAFVLDRTMPFIIHKNYLLECFTELQWPQYLLDLNPNEKPFPSRTVTRTYLINALQPGPPLADAGPSANIVAVPF